MGPNLAGRKSYTGSIDKLVAHQQGDSDRARMGHLLHVLRDCADHSVEIEAFCPDPLSGGDDLTHCLPVIGEEPLARVRSFPSFLLSWVIDRCHHFMEPRSPQEVNPALGGLGGVGFDDISSSRGQWFSGRAPDTTPGIETPGMLLSASRGMTDKRASISLCTRSMSLSFCLRT